MLIDHLKKDFPTRVKLLLTLYDVRLTDRYRLAKLLGVAVSTIDTVIQRINRNGEGKMVFSKTPLFQRGPKLYQLTSLGWRWASAYLDEDRRFDERSESQDKHYNGMVDILIRLIEQMGRYQVYKRVEYLNSYEAEKLILSPFEMAYWQEIRDKKFRYELESDIPFPDLRITIDGKSYWIEYDTGNSSRGKIMEKYQRYYRKFPKKLLRSSSLDHPILWITTSQRRKESMKHWLKLVEQSPEFRNSERVEMHFFAEGEETDFLLNSHSLVYEKVSG